MARERREREQLLGGDVARRDRRSSGRRAKPRTTPSPLGVPMRVSVGRLGRPRERRLGRDRFRRGASSSATRFPSSRCVDPLSSEPERAAQCQVIARPRAADRRSSRTTRFRPTAVPARLELLAVDLRVAGGRSLLAVTQHLADLRKRRARSQHLGRGGVTQRVRTDRRYSCSFARRADDPPHRAAVDRADQCDRAARTRRAALAHRTPLGQIAGRSPPRRRPASAAGPDGFPRTRISPLRQSTSSSVTAATSPARNPSRQSTNTIA